MICRLENPKFIFRKLKISDYQNFSKLFYLCFKKKISYDFYKWRYFNDRFSFCYGAFESSKLIANVGMKSMKLNTNNNERVFSRHTSMVSSNYRGKGIFSTLLEKVKKKFLNKTNLLIMWPNNNNFASFGIKKNRIIRKKYYLYLTLNRKTKIKKKFNNNINNINIININNINKLKVFIKDNNNFFLKNFDYFKSRYLLYKDKEYLINKFELKNFKSFFILKKNKNKSGFNYVILDHFGSEYIKSTHLSQLINNESKVIFWSKKKINKSNLKLINHINLNIGFVKETNIRKQKEMLFNKEFMLGDTDSFITIQ